MKYKMRHPYYPGHEGWEILISGRKVGEVWKFQNMLGLYWVAKAKQRLSIGNTRREATEKLLEEMMEE